MRTYDFQDLSGANVRIQHSSLATQSAYRIYVDYPAEGEGTTGFCLHLSAPQARILIEALTELLEQQ